MAVIVPSGSFNPASLTADDLYIQIQNPPGFIAGVPTDVIGVVGTASWGPVNTAVFMGSPFAALTAWGAISSVALTDPYDLATDLAIAFGQATSQSSIEGFGVRVTDGTDTAATGVINGAATAASITATLANTTAADTIELTFTSTAITGSPVNINYTVPASPSPTPTTAAAALVALINANAALVAAGIFASNVAGVISIYQPTALSPQATVSRTVTGTGTCTLGTGAAVTAGITVPAFYTGIIGNGITITTSVGAASNTTSVSVALPALGLSELYANLPNATFYSAFKTALSMGISGQRGPSQILKGSGATVNNAVGLVSDATTTFSGGTDGRTGVVTATLLGSATAVPPSGIYALHNQAPQVGIVWIVGTTDPTLPASLVAFGQSNGCTTLLPFPTGTTTATALASVASIGAHDPSFAYTKDWIYFYDSVNAVTRLVSPNAYIGGQIATLSPQEGPGNTPVLLCVGTERNNPVTGNNQPYSNSEIGQLASAGVMFVTNPIPAGQVFGIRVGQSTSLNPVTQGVEYWRMTAFLTRSFAASMGQFVDQLQSQQPNDPFRNAVRTQLNTFLTSLVGSNGNIGIIDSFSVICSFTTNPSASPGNGINTPASVAQHYCYVLVRVTYLSVVRFFVLTLQGGTTVVSVGATPGQQLAA
jgi:hypothetical protein